MTDIVECLSVSVNMWSKYKKMCEKYFLIREMKNSSLMAFHENVNDTYF